MHRLLALTTVASLLLVAAACGGSSERSSRRDRAERAEAPAEAQEAGEASVRERRRERETPAEMSDAEREQLEALGYLAGEQEAGEEQGITIHDAGRAYPGTNLLVSGHGHEVNLIAMDGELLHTWRLPKAVQDTLEKDYIRRAWLLDDGGLLVLVEYVALLRLAKDGTVVWRVDQRNHHDVHTADDGTLVSLARRQHAPDWWTGAEIYDDVVQRYDLDGNAVGRHVSVQRALTRSDDAEVLEAAKARPRDSLHTNTIVELGPEAAKVGHPAFQPGRWLLSARNQSLLMVLDPEERRVVWTGRGAFDRQHDARILDDGRLMLFDNGPTGSKASAVEIYDVADLDTPTWRYAGDDTTGPFHSGCCSTAAPLPNGNILVTVTGAGLAFEVTPEGERVWEMHSPFRVPDKPHLVAQLFDVIRTPPVEELDWLMP